MVRTLMKDAREDLVRTSRLKSQLFVQVRLARVQPASHHHWQCKVIFYRVMGTIVAFVRLIGRLVQGLTLLPARA